VLAVGNPLRGDDGAAWSLAAALRLEPGVELVTAHQLLPEMADGLSRARKVFFVDASVSLPPGRAELREVPGTQPAPEGFTHQMSPAALLDLARQLYGRAPGEAWLLEIGAGEFGLSETLSEPVERGVQEALGLLRSRLS
jgi:hydrogenase maturation protease